MPVNPWGDPAVGDKVTEFGGVSCIQNTSFVFFLLRDDALRGMTHGGHFDPWHLYDNTYRVSGGHAIGRHYIQSAMTLPIFETATKYTGPALVINGMADVVVPYTYAERYHSVLKNSSLELIPGENHTYNYSPEYVISFVAEWLKRQLL